MFAVILSLGREMDEFRGGLARAIDLSLSESCV